MSSSLPIHPRRQKYLCSNASYQQHTPGEKCLSLNYGGTPYLRQTINSFGSDPGTRTVYGG